MLVLTCTNQKGGVAKTTTTLCLGYGLIARNYKVLLVDLDPQRNLSSALDYDDYLPTSLDVMASECSVTAAVQCYNGLDFIPASARGGKVDDVLSSAGRDHRLAFALNTVSADYDFCLVDTPPSLGTLTINALTASNYVIIPATADAFSFEGVSDLSDTIDSIRTYTNPSLEIAGILLTRFNPRTNVSQAIYDLALETADALDTRVFKTTIREGVAVRESQVLKEDIFKSYGKSNVAQDYSNFCDELLGVIKQ